MRIDLNSDLGESFGPWPMGQDAALMDSISSANVACGFHAGDPGAMRATIALAREKGVAIGAHPGFQDLVGLRPPRDEGDAGRGRGPRALPGVGAGRHGVGPGRAAPARQGARRALQHGVPRSRARRRHREGGRGASIDRSILFGLPNSELLRAGEAAGLRVAAEVFADRAYDPDGSLTSRAKPGSVIHDTPTGGRARDRDGARQEGDRR